MVISEKDRVLLAFEIGREPGFFAPNYDIPIFDPSKDARDDYAVLLSVRPKESNLVPIMGRKRAFWRDFIFELRLLQLKRGKESSAIYEAYELGDFARAHLNVPETSFGRKTS